MTNMFKVRNAPNLGTKLQEVLDSGMVGEGPKVLEFKQALEKRFGCKNLLPLNSGTSAITLALRLIGVERKEVITTPFTMIATNVAIKAAGGIPVFADINKDNVNISIESIREKITENTAAIIAVHVGGIPCNMQELARLGIPIISDAAHAIDTSYMGEHISQWAHYTAFSFQAIKHLNTGDGGALVIRDDKQYARAEKLKWFGMARIVPKGKTRLEHQMTSDVEEWGYKMHMNDIAATIGLENLFLLDDSLAKHRANARYYNKELKRTAYVGSSDWAYYIFTNKRRELIAELEANQIESTPMWRRNDEYTCFEKADLPNMKELQDKILFIPVGFWLTEEERRKIASIVCKYIS